MLYPVQKYNQPHVVIFPTHIDHLDLTTEGHTLALHEEPTNKILKHLISKAINYRRCLISIMICIFLFVGKGKAGNTSIKSVGYTLNGQTPCLFLLWQVDSQCYYFRFILKLWNYPKNGIVLDKKHYKTDWKDSTKDRAFAMKRYYEKKTTDFI